MANQSLGELIRNFFHELFGSRLALLLENEMFRIRDDYETRLCDKDKLIAEYRDQLAVQRAKLDQYEMIIIPLTSPVGSAFAPKKERQPFEPIADTQSSWTAFQDSYYREQAEADAAAQAANQETTK